MSVREDREQTRRRKDYRNTILHAGISLTLGTVSLCVAAVSVQKYMSLIPASEFSKLRTAVEEVQTYEGTNYVEPIFELQTELARTGRKFRFESHDELEKTLGETLSLASNGETSEAYHRGMKLYMNDIANEVEQEIGDKERRNELLLITLFGGSLAAIMLGVTGIFLKEASETQKQIRVYNENHSIKLVP